MVGLGTMREAARWTVFPVLMGGTLALAIALVPELGAIRGILVAQLAGLLGIVAAERVLPFRPAWNRAHGDVAADLGHALVSGIGASQLARGLVQLAGGVIAAWIVGRVGGTVWPTGWPLAAQLALALPIAELPQYWLHRLQHERDALWRFHAVHHSAPRLYWLNAARFHPVDLALLYVVGYVPLVALGCPADVILLFALFDAVFGMFQHSNVDVRLGPLNRIFSMAEPHRWHHSRVVAEASSNYGSNLLVWDQVFGTYFMPRDRGAPAAIGIADMPDFPPGYLDQLASPFRWDAVRAKAAGTLAG
jgi:ornithine lipid hydroxylase